MDKSKKSDSNFSYYNNTRVPGVIWSASARHRKVMGSMLGLVHSSMLGLDGSMLDQICVIAKDVKGCTYCCYVRCSIYIVRIEGMPCP